MEGPKNLDGKLFNDNVEERGRRVGFFEFGVAGAARMLGLAVGAGLDWLDLIGRSGLRSSVGRSMCVLCAPSLPPKS